jgi:hypothetical protein
MWVQLVVAYAQSGPRIVSLLEATADAPSIFHNPAINRNNYLLLNRFVLEKGQGMQFFSQGFVSTFFRICTFF